MVNKIISGGQMGVDQAALYVAFRLGIPTGGWAPKGYQTLCGEQPFLLGKVFRLKQHTSKNYQARTFANVRDSDGTLRLAFNFSSPGERCTMRAIRYFERPNLDIPLVDPLPHVKGAIEWLSEQQIYTLNIAGNARFGSLNVFTIAKDVLFEILKPFRRKLL